MTTRLAVGLSALLHMLLAGCGGGGDGAVITSEYQDLPSDRVLYGAETQITVKGVREVVLTSDSMYADEDSTTAQLFGVKLMKYDTLGRTTANVTARRGRYNQRTQNLVAQGSVVVTLSDGRRVETEELNYDPESHQIWSDVFTVVRHPNGEATRFQTFSTDDKFQNMTGTGMTGRIPGLKL
jgi:LPS export ABC transporter protein LptC